MSTTSTHETRQRWQIARGDVETVGPRRNPVSTTTSASGYTLQPMGGDVMSGQTKRVLRGIALAAVLAAECARDWHGLR